MAEFIKDLSFKPTINPSPRALTAAQIDSFNENGFLKPFRIYDQAGADKNRAFLDKLLAEIVAADDGRDAYSVNGYQMQCESLWDMATNPKILDLVEDLIGPDFVCWGTHIFCKLPHDPRIVPWHQDASYWPFDKARTVTAWLALDDVDVENAAMQVLPGTHRKGHLKWQEAAVPSVLNQQIVDVDKLGEPVNFELKAGEISLHADMLAHGSPANFSDRRRAGLTMRYCPVSVRAREGFGWASNAIVCRGTDPSGHWGNVPRPEGDSAAIMAWQSGDSANAGG